MKSKDTRGQGHYDVFPDLNSGQINLTTTYPGIIRAFHRHHRQDDNWYIVSGQFEVVVARDDEDVKVYYLGPGESIKIKPLLWHGFRVLGNESGTLLYWTTEKYDPKSPDEDRVRFDRFYSWKTEYK